MGTHATLATSRPVDGRPGAAYRQAGDRYVLVEYGPPRLDLRLNFFAQHIWRVLTNDPPPGLVDAAPGLRSVLLRFDPGCTGRMELIDRLRYLHAQQPPPDGITLPGRRIVLPLAFDDSRTREAVTRYTTTVRQDAPNTRGGNNIDYIVAQNRLSGREALYERLLGVEWWTAFTGFAPGLPFLFALHCPATTLSVPKYNPTRVWTPEGAVGLGGPCLAIYPVQSPGSFQLVGRTLPIYDIHARNRVFHRDPFLLRAGDRVRFTRVEEPELLRLRESALDDGYPYEVEDAPLVVADHLSGSPPSPDSPDPPDSDTRWSWSAAEVP